MGIALIGGLPKITMVGYCMHHVERNVAALADPESRFNRRSPVTALNIKGGFSAALPPLLSLSTGHISRLNRHLSSLMLVNNALA